MKIDEGPVSQMISLRGQSQLQDQRSPPIPLPFDFQYKSVLLKNVFWENIKVKNKK